MRDRTLDQAEASLAQARKLRGTKIFVTSGQRADHIVVWATLDKSKGRAAIKSFVVPRDHPGVSVDRLEHKLGIRASDTAQISFTDWNLLSDPENVGLANYQKLLGDEKFWAMVKAWPESDKDGTVSRDEYLPWIEEQTGAELHAVYHFASITHGMRRVRFDVSCPEDDPRVPTIVDIYPANDWHERETWDMFGIIFDGHPSLTRILMPDDWPGHPQRKDYPLGGIPVEYKGGTVPPPDQRRSYS